MSDFICVDSVICRSTTSIDLLSFDIGQINMGIIKIRYDYATKRFCILNMMLLNIRHPLQRLNENDAEEVGVEFPVDSYYAQPINEFEIRQLNHTFSERQHVLRKRARVTEQTEFALQFATNGHPSNVAKRRKAKLELRTVSATLERSGPLKHAELIEALDIHEWISDLSQMDFILLENQTTNNGPMREIFAGIIVYFEMKRRLTAPRSNVQIGTSNLNLAPFIKSCSASNKLAEVTDALYVNWKIESSRNDLFLTIVQLRKLLKDHFQVTSSTVNTENYGKRKISSVKEMTHFFCDKIIKKARELARNPDGSLPDVCPEHVLETLATFPVNSHAYWIVNQLGKKVNVTDAILQAFAWMNQCEIPQ